MRSVLNLFRRSKPVKTAKSNGTKVVGSDALQPRDRAADKVELSFDGYEKSAVQSGQVDFLSADDLRRLNNILPWMCFTADSKGRRFGNTAWKGKRDTPQQIPDARIVQFDSLFNLSDKSVLEVGCFEGIHTIALAQRAKKVYAIDSRIENVVKTIVRANLFGFTPAVSVCDLERGDDIARLTVVDLLHHVGVLYHLKNPVEHLVQLGAFTRSGILLDTHYATQDMADKTFESPERTYRYYSYKEKGRNEVFSGMYDHAKWLLLEDIEAILKGIGFSDIRIYKDELQRNGPRVTLYAARPSVMATL
jgi:hypothetical protein